MLAIIMRFVDVINKQIPEFNNIRNHESVLPNIPPENVEAMAEAALE